MDTIRKLSSVLFLFFFLPLWGATAAASEQVQGIRMWTAPDNTRLVFDVSGADLRVSPVPSTAPSEHTVAGFAVPEVAATVAWLSERGVVFERFDGFPHDERGVLTSPDGARVAWFRDPDGNLLSVVEFPA